MRLERLEDEKERALELIERGVKQRHFSLEPSHHDEELGGANVCDVRCHPMHLLQAEKPDDAHALSWWPAARLPLSTTLRTSLLATPACCAACRRRRRVSIFNPERMHRHGLSAWRRSPRRLTELPSRWKHAPFAVCRVGQRRRSMRGRSTTASRMGDPQQRIFLRVSSTVTSQRRPQKIRKEHRAMSSSLSRVTCPHLDTQHVKNAPTRKMIHAAAPIDARPDLGLTTNYAARPFIPNDVVIVSALTADSATGARLECSGPKAHIVSSELRLPLHNVVLTDGFGALSAVGAVVLQES